MSKESYGGHAMPQAVSHWPLTRVHKNNTTYKLYAVKDKEIALIEKNKKEHGQMHCTKPTEYLRGEIKVEAKLYNIC
jgi:hypothetical protein